MKLLNQVLSKIIFAEGSVTGCVSINWGLIIKKIKINETPGSVSSYEKN